MTGSQALDEIQARAHQGSPDALVPVNDPMTTVGADIDIIPGDLPTAANLSILKTDAYRLGVGQPLLFNGAAADAQQYCQNLAGAGTQVTNEANTYEMGVIFPVSGTVFGTFMLGRYAASLQLLNCALFNPAPTVTPTVTPAVTPTVTPAVTPAVTPTMTPTMTPSDSYTGN